jgi:hypothetical protein
MGTNLLNLTEIFQAFVFDRSIDLPLIGYGFFSWNSWSFQWGGLYKRIWVTLYDFSPFLDK